MPTFRIASHRREEHHPVRIEVDAAGKARAVYEALPTEYATLDDLLADLELDRTDLEEQS